MRAIPPNIVKYYLLRLFSGLTFTYVIQAIFLLSRGITPAQLATYASLTVICSTALDIPTGYIADRFGRKASVASSYIAGGLASLAFIFVNDFYGLALVALLTGLSSALASGALESLMYDEIQQNHPELSFLKVTTTGSNIAIVAAAFSSFVSPILYVANPAVPFVLNAAADLVTAVFVLFFEERGHAHRRLQNLKLIDGIGHVLKLKPIRFIVLIELCLLIFVNIYYRVLFFPKIQSLGMNVEYLGVVDVLTLAITSVLLHLIARVSFKGEQMTLSVYSLAVALTFVCFGLSTALIPALVFGILFDPLWNIRRHILPTITNRYFEAHDRALSLSSMSFVSSLGAALLVPAAMALFTQSYWFSVAPVAVIIVLLLAYPREPLSPR